ncbi:MAG: hypothetical protein KDA89_23725, partial [Planctomycetaceae bacterium]|nr:hypothetical protein [Planctomycetaceae bacterium]
SKWGPLDDQTSVHKLAGDSLPTHFIINDLGTPLSDNTGLFVYTTPAGQSGNYYYAVTQVTNGIENRVISASSNATTTAVAESAAAPAPILVQSLNNGHGLVYTQFMDYDKWNPTFQGYAYNYSVALPPNYSADNSYPLKLQLHAYTERYSVHEESSFGWPAIMVFADDPGESAGTIHTWWYGFSADHNYQTDGPIPTSGRIENFTEQRVLRALDEVIQKFSVDTTRIHSQGHSMGASGSLSLGIRYGNVFAGIHASEPMTNYASSPTFQTDFERLWGTQASNLPVVNNGIHAAPLVPYNGTGVYNWMNHHEQVVRRRGEDMAFLMFGHGTADTTIDWQTQGKPFPQILNDANIAFTAEDRFNWEHTFMGFSFAIHDLFSAGFEDLGDWEFRNDFSFPAISNAAESSALPPVSTATSFYNLTIDWSVPWNSFGVDPIDATDHYEITLRSRTVTQTADVTPRNTQRFSASAGAAFTWENLNVGTGQVVAAGTVTADAKGVITVPGFRVEAGSGSRLILQRTAGIPVITAPIGDQTSTTPVFRWSDVTGAAAYRIWITSRTTGASPYLDINVTDSQFTPPAELPLGRYTLWVRALMSNGSSGPWSTPMNFQIRPAAQILTAGTSFSTLPPTIDWSAVTGAARYQVWV